MKVLDPQSALLTNHEVSEFLQSNPTRKADKQVGVYAAVNVGGRRNVANDFRRYTSDVTPHVLEQESPETWMQDVVQKMKGYGLVKSEVVGLLNLGVGARLSAEDAGEGTEEDEDVNGGLVLASSNESLFRLVVEECDERFPGDEGEIKIQEILQTLREAVKVKTVQTNGS